MSIYMPRCNNKTVPVGLMSMKIQWKSFFLVSTVLLPPILTMERNMKQTYPAWTTSLLRDHHNQGAFGCSSSIILPIFILWTLSLARRNWKGCLFLSDSSRRFQIDKLVHRYPWLGQVFFWIINSVSIGYIWQMALPLLHFSKKPFFFLGTGKAACKIIFYISRKKTPIFLKRIIPTPGCTGVESACLPGRGLLFCNKFAIKPPYRQKICLVISIKIGLRNGVGKSIVFISSHWTNFFNRNGRIIAFNWIITFQHLGNWWVRLTSFYFTYI